MKIDMGPVGPLGMDVTITDGVLYLGGSNHWMEWAHHFLPGARRREIRWGQNIADVIENRREIRIIAGHSVGGTVACIATRITRKTSLYCLPIYLCTYGAKRPPRGYRASGRHYRIKGDIVPSLPPWRPALALVELDNDGLSRREAHGPCSYYEQMAKDGVR